MEKLVNTKEIQAISNDLAPAAVAPEPALLINNRSIESLSGALKPPLVSFVLINWNYARFVGQAINSIRAQDYPHFECLVIDNGSTDNSRDVIAQHVKDDPRFAIECLPENLGQLGAAFWAFARIKGGFVTFVDADDVLFPSFASTHIQVHLALPRSVALTSSNILEMNTEGRLGTGGYLNFTKHSADSYTVRGLRRSNTAVRVSTISEDGYARLDHNTVILPHSLGGWLWAPGTSNMFRRSILEMSVIKSGGPKFMRSADGHFNFLCHALAGTALIDIPLCGYRLHGANFFAARESVPALRQGTEKRAARSELNSRQTLEILLDRADFFAWILRGRYWTMIDQLTLASAQKLKMYYRAPGTVELFTRHVAKMRDVFGDKQTIQQLRRRFPVMVAWRILQKGAPDRIPPSFRLLFWRLEAKRFSLRMKRSKK